MEHHDQEFLLQKIRTQYTEKIHTELDELKALDKKVKRPANVFAYGFGSLSAIVMGCGMSLVMTDLGAQIGMAQTMLPGVIIGVVGLACAVVNAPLHKGMLNKRKKQYADQIISLSEKLVKGAGENNAQYGR